MKRVKGLGGVFFKTNDPKMMKAWYEKHLGIPDAPYGATFEWRKSNEETKSGFTAWSIFSDTTKYFQPSSKEFMINYRVENLVELLKVLKEEGVTIVGEVDEQEYGKFAWILDPEGNKIELWEPVDKVYTDILDQDHVIKSE